METEAAPAHLSANNNLGSGYTPDTTRQNKKSSNRVKEFKGYSFFSVGANRWSASFQNVYIEST